MTFYNVKNDATILLPFSGLLWFYSMQYFKVNLNPLIYPFLINLIYLAKNSLIHWVCNICSAPNVRDIKLVTSFWTQWSIHQPKRQMFPSGVGGGQSRAEREWLVGFGSSCGQKHSSEGMDLIIPQGLLDVLTSKCLLEHRPLFCY